MNRKRGVSALRQTGPRQPLSVSKYPLPMPVMDPAKHTQFPTAADHGLWAFFGSDRAAIQPPEKELNHGRAWVAAELRAKSWEDLQQLWWVCIKERNRLATQTYERERMKAGYGGYEEGVRHQAVRRTMQRIKFVLTERWYAWEAARKVAAGDPSVDLTGERGAYDGEMEGGEGEEVDNLEYGGLEEEEGVIEDGPAMEEKKGGRSSFARLFSRKKDPFARPEDSEKAGDKYSTGRRSARAQGVNGSDASAGMPTSGGDQAQYRPETTR